MTVVDALGFFGTILNVWGNLLIARKSSRGWWVRIACNLVWIAHGAIAPSISIAANAIIFLGINVYGIHEWRKER